MSPQLTVTPELKTLLRRVKLGRCLDTLPERLTLAHQHKLTHHEFLELLLADEVTRRDTQSAILRSKTAGLDPAMLLERWDDTAKITYDRTIWNELCSLRFVDAPNDVVILGPVGVGKTFLATALGHIAVRRGRSVHFERADTLLKRLKATRLDNSHDIDDFALRPMDVTDTAEVYEIIVERHRRASTILTSNRDPGEMLAQMADPLLAQSAIDRLHSNAHELVIDGESYRRRQRPGIDTSQHSEPSSPRRH
jgi:DNA replication protein DnaC